MDAEERDELKENDLASWLQFGLWNFLKENGSYLLLAVALTFLGYQLWSLHKQRQEFERLNAWGDLREAERESVPDKMLEVLDHHQQDPVRAQAYLWLGDYYDKIIVQPELLDSRKLTRDDALSHSLEDYQHALDAAGTDLVLAGKAHLGLAAASEDKGDWDKAKAEYQILTDKTGKFANTPFAALAAGELAELDDRRTAPRLASMIPPPTPVTPTLPQLPGGSSGSQFPGLLDNVLNPLGPPSPILNSSNSSSPPTTSVGPFMAPSIPGLAPTPQAQPGDAPTTPAPVVPAPAPAAAPASPALVPAPSPATAK